jgi:outer membrane protein assembly factor BamB
MAFRSAICSILLFGAVATAADWPTFRGPNRDGVSAETGLLKSWPEGGPQQVWIAKNLGIGWSTPSIAGGVIYGVGSRDGKDGVWALKEADGSELWFRPFANSTTELFPQSNGRPSSTPTVHNNKLYTVSGDGTLSCMNASDGSAVWTKNYVKDFGAPPSSREGVAWGYSDSVLADGDKVICTPAAKGAALVALKADTGETIWKADVGPIAAPNSRGFNSGQGYSSPVKATIGGVPQYLLLGGNGSGLIGVHAENGKLLWQYKGNAATGGIAQIPMPVVKDDRVWVSCSYNGGAALLQIVSKGKDEFEAKEIKAYRNSQLNNHHGGMVLVKGHVYFGHDRNGGSPVCVDFKTGEIKWGPEKMPAGGQKSAAVLYADGRLYFRYENGVLVLIEPSPDELKVVSSFKLPAANQRSHPQSWPHPVIVNGKLYIRDQDVMYCYDVKAK